MGVEDSWQKGSGILDPEHSGPKGPRSLSSICSLPSPDSLLLSPYKGTAPICEKGDDLKTETCVGCRPYKDVRIPERRTCLCWRSLWDVHVNGESDCGTIWTKKNVSPLKNWMTSDLSSMLTDGKELVEKISWRRTMQKPRQMSVWATFETFRC